MIPLAVATAMTRPGEPLLAAPSSAQRALEGEFFDAVRDLHCRPDLPAAGSSTASRLSITRIVPGRHRLDVRLSPDTLLTSWLPAALPSLDHDGDLVGVPGLRLHVAGPDAVRLTRLEEQAEIVLVGADSGDLDAYLDAAHRAVRRLDLRETLHPAEVETGRDTGRPRPARAVHHDAMSAAIRRLGLLLPFHPRWVDGWDWLGGGAVVEVFADRLRTDLVDVLIDDMTSGWLEPRLRLRVRDGDDRTAVRLVFASDDVRSFIQIRLRRD